ncbi:helicase-exonuclease AddAB subunit AddB [Pseudalkalibacillus hwajinpoensis]|uniref:ATP-dependent helicase/deoxyribonuclease subunit B n=1 Tax=Guptibacillus hwajinpoensis TaxID=208199 RepID=A0A4U1MNB9_9BACL|nr:helicase-exonuclease AddAB subunit AddB [Pseudalkalibacillus hwajinpoensis]TKD71960.1 helicase-exonuclease AddAB subunit AddB [Pseudalkalibacillus hwajinpoensis]
MTVQFVIGRSGSGKTDHCLSEIQNELTDRPIGQDMIYLVPEQMTFQSEYELVHNRGLKGMIRAQVFSFTRLAWKVLQETGGMARPHLTSVGTSMMLRHIIEENKQKLRIYQRSSEKTGYIEQLNDMVTEFKRYCLEPDDIRSYADDLYTEDERSLLKDKLFDLHLVYDAFQKAMIGHYLDSEDYLALLAEKIEESSYLDGATILIDGFHSFTPQELLVIQALIKKGTNLSFTITMDPEMNLSAIHELDLFHEPAKTYQTLLGMANEEGVEVKQPLVLTSQKRYRNSELAHLEANYGERPPILYSGQLNQIQLHHAVNIRSEVEAAARETLRLVRDEGYRFRDISVMVRNMASYYELVETIFGDHNIPIFSDQKRTMLHHPLIELLRSSLDIIQYNWRYEAVFRCVKTELLFPDDTGETVEGIRERMDELENYVIARGIKGYRWKTGERWKSNIYRQLEDKETITSDELEKMEDRLNETKEWVSTPLEKFERRMKKANTVRDMCEALYYLLENSSAAEKVDRLKEKAEQAGQLTKAREHDQVWDAVVSLLDETVELIGDQKLTVEQFTKLLEAGIESMKFALVPASLDQVVIGSIDRTRFTNVKCGFLLGVNDGVLPARIQEDGLLSEQDREKLEEQGIQLAPGLKRRLLDEEFLIYHSLSTPSDALWVSCPLADEEGKGLQPSIVMNRLQEMFPELEVGLKFAEPGEEAIDELSFITNPSKTIGRLTGQLRQWNRGYPIDPIWWDTYNWFVRNPSEEDKLRLIDSLFYRNKARDLSEETSRKLYGSNIQASVSRMERYKSCAFSQFASHGLKLKERSTFKLEAPDIGQLFHAALNMMAETIKQRHWDWGKISSNQYYELSGEIVEQIAPKLQNEILLSSNRYHYIMRKLTQVVGRASSVLGQQAQKSGFQPAGLELGFGPNQELPPIEFTLKNGVKLQLIGRVDRVDQAFNGDELLLRIIDYKSSGTSLDLSEVYFGLALQMLTYLDVVITNANIWLGRDATAAGMLYFHVHNPMLQTSAPGQAAIQQELFKKFKMKGLLLADKDVVSLMDSDIELKKSDIIPAALKKDGSFYKNSSVLSSDDFQSLRSFTRNTIQEIGADISDGRIDIDPYKMKDRIPCTFCSYRSFCQFDQAMEDNVYKQIPVEDDETILRRMREGEHKNESN